MPKLARKYGNNAYIAYQQPEVYDYNKYKEYIQKYTQNPQQMRVKKVARHKRTKSPLKALISLLILAFTVFFILPFAYKNITVSVFYPTPHSKIKTDMHRLAFPTSDYIVNNWFLGERNFSYSISGKKAQMVEIKESVDMPLLRQQLTSLAKLYPSVSPSVYVWDYETGNYLDIDANKSYSAASIIKIPILIDLFKTVETGQISLDDKMNLSEIYRTEGSGSLQFKAHNSEYSIDELARMMITESDNSSTNMLVSKVGSMDDVNSSLRTWGIKSTYMKTWLPDLKGTNRTTAKDMATMLYNIDENEKFLSAESRQKIFDYMGHVHNNRLIQAGLGQGAKFLHKTGDIGTMLGDAGIVITPKGNKYIIVILANRPHNSVLGKEYIVHASEIIYNYMVK